MNINDINIYLVSLEKDKERRESLNIIPDYTYAVDGSKLDIDKLKSENILTKDCTLSKGEIGCFLSHIHLLNKVVDTGKYTLILEDDAKVPEDLIEKIIKTIKTAPGDFDILFLGYNYYEEYTTFKQINYLHGAQAYLINPKNMNKEKINKLLPISKPYDLILPIFFKTYIVIPKIVELHEKFGGISNTQSIR